MGDAAPARVMNRDVGEQRMIVEGDVAELVDVAALDGRLRH